MKKISKQFILTLCTISLILIAIIVVIAHFVNNKRLITMIVSCNNHQRFLERYLDDYIAKNGQFPYDTTKKGYVFLAEFSSISEAYVNCNHGAPHSQFGGWQMVNLNPDIWKKIFDQWEPSQGDPIPFAWCGRTTGISTRLVTIITYRPEKEEHSLSLSHKNMEGEELQERLQRLNDILKGIGEKPIPLNIPEGIDWSKYKQEIENKEDSSNSDSAVAKPE